MGNETRKNDYRRLVGTEYGDLFIGRGIDIGCGASPVTPECDKWDKAQGDATYMKGVPIESYDWVYSSHCLEHIEDPKTAIINWWYLVAPNGHLIVTVPDYYLYEKKIMPSRFNRDHKHAYSILKHANTLNLLDIFSGLSRCQIRWIRTNDRGFDYNDKVKDQTATRGAQAEIEIVAKKLIDSFWTE